MGQNLFAPELAPVAAFQGCHGDVHAAIRLSRIVIDKDFPTSYQWPGSWIVTWSAPQKRSIASFEGVHGLLAAGVDDAILNDRRAACKLTGLPLPA